MAAACVLFFEPVLPAQASDTFELEGARIELSLPTKPLSVSRAEIIAWITRGVRAVGGYYGSFPVKKLKIEVMSEGSRAIGLGQAFNGDLIRFRLGSQASQAAFLKDWSMTHEMLHLAFPDLDDEHTWMQEGMATYLEPIARERAGQLTKSEVMEEWKSRFPDGLPAAGDRGMNIASGYPRIYWGGAIFWHFADVEIRRRSHGKKSIDDVMRAVLGAGGTQNETWKVDRLLKIADQATGTQVLRELYEQTATRAYSPDLAKHWRSLEPAIVDAILAHSHDRPIH